MSVGDEEHQADYFGVNIQKSDGSMEFLQCVLIYSIKDDTGLSHVKATTKPVTAIV